LLDPVVTAMLDMARTKLPVLLSVTDCGALEEPASTPVNVSVVGVRETLEPSPVKLTACGLPLALSVMVRAPVSVPVEVGVKVTLIVQAPLALMLVPHVLVEEKSPLATMLVKVSVALPELVTVTD
jgi:hypothetical protein